MIYLYKILVNILFLIVLPCLPFLYFFSEKRRASLVFRFGFKTRSYPKKTDQKRIWIHALSVGEVKSVVPFVQALKAQYKDLNIVFTASTKTGFDMAHQIFFKKDASLADQLRYFPYDLGYCVKKAIRQIAPDAVILVETDVWPNLLYEMKKSKIPVLLINARLSKRSLKGYLFFRKFASMFFSSITQIMAQTDLDAKRFQQLGINTDKISVAGNIKFDQPIEDMSKSYIKDMKNRFCIQKQTKVFIAGSTHDGEEKILCKVYKDAKKNFPDLFMILAPRNPKRCQDIASLFLSKGVHVQFMSIKTEHSDCPDVVLVDKMGELSRLYAICDIAFIGGSMVQQGGHNPLEPASFSKPILFGLDMSDFSLISNMLVDQGGAKKVGSQQELKEALEMLLKNNQISGQMGFQSFEVFSQNSGAVNRIINNMEHLKIV
ncbi:MAG: 3-deoxy-D-manno-octulosonic acid transferase [Desulfobacteraceae bacterium]|nr:3-deoxy-D-manno-octulosonic acid transferase [Desulfobacteraceae bacterium]